MLTQPCTPTRTGQCCQQGCTRRATWATLEDGRWHLTEHHCCELHARLNRWCAVRRIAYTFDPRMN